MFLLFLFQDAEKKRRDRINRCLDQLEELIPYVRQKKVCITLYVKTFFANYKIKTKNKETLHYYDGMVLLRIRRLFHILIIRAGFAAFLTVAKGYKIFRMRRRVKIEALHKLM